VSSGAWCGVTRCIRRDWIVFRFGGVFTDVDPVSAPQRFALHRARDDMSALNQSHPRTFMNGKSSSVHVHPYRNASSQESIRYRTGTSFPEKRVVCEQDHPDRGASGGLVL
jgi:hypothetical protein